jgi:hypothetical protein
MEKDKAPSPGPLAAANDNCAPPIASAKVNATLKRIARLVGRQIAREEFEQRSAANDNDKPRCDR